MNVNINAFFTPRPSLSSPGYAATVIRNGSGVSESCTGVANLSTGSLITRVTNFRLASLSKQFTAMAVMILQERKFLKYDDLIEKYLSGFSDSLGRVTIRHLLTHTSGMPDHEKSLYRQFKIGQHATMRDALEILRSKKRLLFPAGSTFQYSDAGYAVLASIIETIPGLSYRQFLKKEIFSPLGMTDSDVLDESQPNIKNRALGYRTKIYYPRCGRITDNRKSGLRFSFELFDDDPLNFIVGDEGVYSSIADMVKWNRVWDEELLVSAATLKEAFTPQQFSDGRLGKAGFSWLVKDVDGKRLIYQDGAWVGFRNITMRIPAEQVTVIILSNRTDLDSEKHRLNAAMTLAQRATKT